MIRTLLTTTALAALLAGGAFAQDAAPATTAPTAGATDTTVMSADSDDLASRIIGSPLYSGPANGAEQIGEVNDLVIGQDGRVIAVTVSVGGFLGMGEKIVSIDFSQLKMVVAEDNTERWVLETTKEALEVAPAFAFIDDNAGAENAVAETAATDAAAVDAAAAEASVVADAAAAEAAAVADAASVDAAAADAATADAPAAVAVVTDTPADAAAPTDSTAVTADQATASTPVDRASMTDLDETTLTAQELLGTRVVGPDNKDIAEVGELTLTEDGKIDAVLIDFGDFLGIGEKRVAVAMDDLDFATDANGSRYVFLTALTREQLEAAQTYDETTYATDRDNQRLTIGAI